MCDPEFLMASAFNDLVVALRAEGYSVEVTREGAYTFGNVKGNDVSGGFCTSVDPDSADAPYWYINGRFAADHVDCFNKWSQCPFVVALPTTTEKVQELLVHLKWLGSPEALEWSSSFGYLDDPRLPREV